MVLKKGLKAGIGLMAVGSLLDRIGGKKVRKPSKRRLLVDASLLTLRATLGGLMVGHGSQKLFGAFGGYGIQGTAGWLESLGLQPGRRWATLAGLSEFGGGLMTALGFLSPIGPLSVVGSMGMAIAKVHPLTKPIWVSEGGAELPLTNIAIATALMVSGPGRFSLDKTLGTGLPRWIALPGLAAVAGMVAYGAMQEPQQQDQQDQQDEQDQQREAGQSAE